MTLFNKRIFYTVLILFLILNFSIKLFSQTEIGLLPINIDLNERAYVDAFRKLKTNVKKTHQPPYQGDIEMHLENYLKRYLNFKGIKLVDFPMDKLSKEEIKEKRKLYYNLNNCLRYIKEKNSLKGRIALKERMEFKKKTPPEVPNKLIMEFAEKMDQPFLLHIKAVGAYYRSKKEINGDASYKKTPHGYLSINVTLLDGKTGDIVATYSSRIGKNGSRAAMGGTGSGHSYSIATVGMIKRYYKLHSKVFARKIKKDLVKHFKK